MTGFKNRNVLLLAALVAVAAGVFYLGWHSSAPVSHDQPTTDRFPHYATVRSSRHASAEHGEEQRAEQVWENALNSADRCVAMSFAVNSGDSAQLAMKWAQGIEDDSRRKMALEAILCAWTKFDSQAAVNWGLSITNNPSARSFAITSVFESWVAQDAKAASAYVATLGQVDQTYAIAAVAPALTAQNPQDAIRWAQAFGEEDARNLATHAVVTTWAANAPSVAAAWVATEPEGYDRADDVRTVVQKWLGTDANAAADWANQLPAGTSRDSGLDAIAAQLTYTDPALASRWGEAIDREDLRDARLEAIAGKWLSVDPDAARSWLNNAPLSDKAKAEVLTPGSASLQ